MAQCPHAGAISPKAGAGAVLAPDDLLAACEPFLGPVTLVSDRSWPLGDDKVIEVSDREGRRWIAKAVLHREGYEREVHALSRWAPALAGGGPALLAADEERQLLIIASRPDLRDAFYAGYGRAPTEADLALLRCYLAYSALSTVVWAREHGDPDFEEQGRRTIAQLRAGTLTVS
jgi:hypothetical protein